MKRSLAGLFAVAALAPACKGSSMSEPQGAVPTGTPPVAPGGMPAGTKTTGSIEGQLQVGPAAQGHVNAGDTIFIIARSATTGGMVAATKLKAETFPMAFKIGSDNIMLPGGSVDGPVKLSARVDKDGDAMSKNPGDVVGEVTTPVAFPSNGVVITLNQVL